MTDTKAKPVRRRRNRPKRETAEILTDAARMVRRFGVTAGNGDPEHFALIRNLVVAAREAEVLAVAGLRAQEYSDQEIAEGGRMTRRNVLKRFPRAPQTEDPSQG